MPSPTTPPVDDGPDRIAPGKRPAAIAVTAAGCVLFLVAAVLGWIKLRYGFGFHDEGMYMTDAWRLTAGDSLFPDSFPSVVRLYVVFNAAVFSLVPDITLLGFRRLQFVLALLAIGATALAARRISGPAPYLPWVLAPFAFTGLQVKGTASNLSYHTYPHLFFALYFAALLLALTCRGRGARAGWLLAAGTCLWAAGFSLLPLSAGAAAPVVAWLLGHWLKVEGPRLTVRDVALVLAPVVVLWLGCAVLWGADLFHAVRAMWGFMGEKSQGGVFDTDAWAYVAAAGAFLLAVLGATRLRGWRAAAAVAALGAALGWAVGTNLGGLLPPYWNGWFSRPMWLAGVLVAGTAVFLAGAVLERRRRGTCRFHAGLPFIVLTQVAVLGTVFAHFSDSRTLSFTYLAIPGAVALAAYLAAYPPREAGPAARAGLVLALLLPVSAWTAWADWRFTYFDRAPEQLTYTIPDGFAAGIVTNPQFGAMAEWIARSARTHAREGDTAIFLRAVPMGHMLTGLRPALNHSFLGMGRSMGLRREAVVQMIRTGREPRVAYRFLRFPFFYPVPGDPGGPLFGKPVRYAPNDPVNWYVTHRMRLVDRFKLDGEPWIELYVARGPDGAGGAGR